MSELLWLLLGAALGSVLGWVACTLHWHTRLAESWNRLRAAVWRRQTHKTPVRPERAVDVNDVTSAFGYGLVAEEDLASNRPDDLNAGGSMATERHHRRQSTELTRGNHDTSGSVPVNGGPPADPPVAPPGGWPVRQRGLSLVTYAAAGGRPVG